MPWFLQQSLALLNPIPLFSFLCRCASLCLHLCSIVFLAKTNHQQGRFAKIVQWGGCGCACVWMWAHACGCERMRADVSACVRMWVCVCTWVSLCVCVCVCVCEREREKGPIAHAICPLLAIAVYVFACILWQVHDKVVYDTRWLCDFSPFPQSTSVQTSSTELGPHVHTRWVGGYDASPVGGRIQSDFAYGCQGKILEYVFSCVFPSFSFFFLFSCLFSEDFHQFSLFSDNVLLCHIALFRDRYYNLTVLYAIQFHRWQVFPLRKN